MRVTLPGRAIVGLALVLATSACGTALGNLGGLGTILGGGLPGSSPRQGQVTAEIQQVDTRQQAIFVQTQDGRSAAIGYDQSTQVVYQQREYPVTALERGDVVVLQVQQDARGNLRASRIDVQQSVQERTGQSGATSGPVQQFVGRVGQIDAGRGLFQLQTQYSGALIVSLPYNAPQATVQSFQRLRTGDSVRLEGTALGNGRVELYRFY